MPRSSPMLAAGPDMQKTWTLPGSLPGQLSIMPVLHLRFTHDKIRPVFRAGQHSGHPIYELVNDLVKGYIDPTVNLAPLEVYYFQGAWRSLNNRRLWALKAFMGLTGNFHLMVQVVVSTCSLSTFVEKNSTRNDGLSVEITGDEAGLQESFKFDRQLCKYYSSRGYCLRGSSCPFFHSLPDEPQVVAASPKQAAKGLRKAACVQAKMLLRSMYSKLSRSFNPDTGFQSPCVSHGEELRLSRKGIHSCKDEYASPNAGYLDETSSTSTDLANNTTTAEAWNAFGDRFSNDDLTRNERAESDDASCLDDLRIAWACQQLQRATASGSSSDAGMAASSLLNQLRGRVWLTIQGTEGCDMLLLALEHTMWSDSQRILSELQGHIMCAALLPHASMVLQQLITHATSEALALVAAEINGAEARIASDTQGYQFLECFLRCCSIEAARPLCHNLALELMDGLVGPASNVHYERTLRSILHGCSIPCQRAILDKFSEMFSADSLAAYPHCWQRVSRIRESLKGSPCGREILDRLGLSFNPRHRIGPHRFIVKVLDMEEGNPSLKWLRWEDPTSANADVAKTEDQFPELGPAPLLGYARPTIQSVAKQQDSVEPAVVKAAEASQISFTPEASKSQWPSLPASQPREEKAAIQEAQPSWFWPPSSLHEKAMVCNGSNSAGASKHDAYIDINGEAEAAPTASTVADDSHADSMHMSDQQLSAPATNTITIEVHEPCQSYKAALEARKGSNAQRETLTSDAQAESQDARASRFVAPQMSPTRRGGLVASSKVAGSGDDQKARQHKGPATVANGSVDKCNGVSAGTPSNTKNAKEYRELGESKPGPKAPESSSEINVEKSIEDNVDAIVDNTNPSKDTTTVLPAPPRYMHSGAARRIKGSMLSRPGIDQSNDFSALCDASEGPEDDESEPFSPNQEAVIKVGRHSAPRDTRSQTMMAQQARKLTIKPEPECPKLQPKTKGGREKSRRAAKHKAKGGLTKCATADERELFEESIAEACSANKNGVLRAKVDLEHVPVSCCICNKPLATLKDASELGVCKQHYRRMQGEERRLADFRTSRCCTRSSNLQFHLQVYVELVTDSWLSQDLNSQAGVDKLAIFIQFLIRKGHQLDEAQRGMTAAHTILSFIQCLPCLALAVIKVLDPAGRRATLRALRSKGEALLPRWEVSKCWNSMLAGDLSDANTSRMLEELHLRDPEVMELVDKFRAEQGFQPLEPAVKNTPVKTQTAQHPQQSGQGHQCDRTTADHSAQPRCSEEFAKKPGAPASRVERCALSSQSQARQDATDLNVPCKGESKDRSSPHSATDEDARLSKDPDACMLESRLSEIGIHASVFDVSIVLHDGYLYAKQTSAHTLILKEHDRWFFGCLQHPHWGWLTVRSVLNWSAAAVGHRTAVVKVPDIMKHVNCDRECERCDDRSNKPPEKIICSGESRVAPDASSQEPGSVLSNSAPKPAALKDPILLQSAAPSLTSPEATDDEDDSEPLTTGNSTPCTIQRIFESNMPCTEAEVFEQKLMAIGVHCRPFDVEVVRDAKFQAFVYHSGGRTQVSPEHNDWFLGCVQDQDYPWSTVRDICRWAACSVSTVPRSLGVDKEQHSSSAEHLAVDTSSSSAITSQPL